MSCLARAGAWRIIPSITSTGSTSCASLRYLPNMPTYRTRETSKPRPKGRITMEVAERAHFKTPTPLTKEQVTILQQNLKPGALDVSSEGWHSVPIKEYMNVLNQAFNGKWAMKRLSSEPTPVKPSDLLIQDWGLFVDGQCLAEAASLIEPNPGMEKDIAIEKSRFSALKSCCRDLGVFPEYDILVSRVKQHLERERDGEMKREKINFCRHHIQLLLLKPGIKSSLWKFRFALGFKFVHAISCTDCPCCDFSIA
ncbi:uncharacterized protein LOC135810186 isoform X2 [Sycon ciliatum]|uniref:uncharacterized protein LOC135810186 isoform X2 n=1 Tax=Sycon ciliatum TaxID=27933 RepID=UPI0031F60858